MSSFLKGSVLYYWSCSRSVASAWTVLPRLRNLIRLKIELCDNGVSRLSGVESKSSSFWRKKQDNSRNFICGNLSHFIFRVFRVQVESKTDNLGWFSCKSLQHREYKIIPSTPKILIWLKIISNSIWLRMMKT